MHRIYEDEIYVPHLFDDATYGAADPSLGRERHHIKNSVMAKDLAELRRLHGKG